LFAQSPAEPGTGNSQISPATQAPQTHPDPNLRVDSMPHTDQSPSTDSALGEQEGPGTTVDQAVTGVDNLGIEQTTLMDLGYDTTPVRPPDMVGTHQPGNPSLLYLALDQRTPGQMQPADAAIISGRQSDIGAAAHSHGYNLADPGWTYHQVVCPASEPTSILLQYTRGQESGQGENRKGDRESIFTAVIPRDKANSASVQVIGALHDKPVPRRQSLYKNKATRPFQAALPPDQLFAHLQPREDWLATSACIASLGGAQPEIPVWAELDDQAATAPGPLLRLLLDGERKVIFSDQQADNRVSVWNEWISRKGKLTRAEQQTSTFKPEPITNPPVAAPRTISNIPDPPEKILPAPPSPLSGEHQ
jgi:hypothetical protein